MVDNTHDIGRYFYVTQVRFNPEATVPFVEPCWTNETESPFRRGRGLSFHLWPGFILAVGFWRLPRAKEWEVEERILPATPERIREWVGA